MSTTQQVLTDINLWSPYVKYPINDCVIYNGNIYFCIKESQGFIPTETLNQYWVNNDKFIWKPSDSTDSSSRLINRLTNFLGSIGASTIKKNPNVQSLLNLNCSFLVRSDLEAKSIIAFFQSKEGYKIFDFDVPAPYNKTIKCRCINWVNQYSFFDNNSISAQFTQVL